MTPHATTPALGRTRALKMPITSPKQFSTKPLNKGNWSLWNQNVPLRAQPQFRRAQHPLAAWLNPKSNQHAMHDGSANANSHRGVRELKIARTDGIRHRNTVDIGIVTHTGADIF